MWLRLYLRLNQKSGKIIKNNTYLSTYAFAGMFSEEEKWNF